MFETQINFEISEKFNFVGSQKNLNYYAFRKFKLT